MDSQLLRLLLAPGPWSGGPVVLAALLGAAAAASMALAGRLLPPLLAWRRRRARIARLGERFPGPPPWPLLGNALHVGCNPKDIMDSVTGLWQQYGRTFRLWMGSLLHVVITDPRDLEALMTSSKEINKGFLYRFFEPNLGQGLITAGGDHWRSHRKLIEPAFHTRLLDQFVPVFRRQTGTFLRQLAPHAGGPAFDVAELTDLLALDIICETAMGVQLNAQLDSDSEYVRALQSMERTCITRCVRPWLYPDLLFRLSPTGRLQASSLKVLHGTRDQVVRERKQQLETQHSQPEREREQEQEQEEKQEAAEAAKERCAGLRRRLAFLDHLLEAARAGAPLSDQDIAEEVATVMAAGHDTTSKTMAYALFMLARHPDVQERVVRELEAAFGAEGPPEIDPASLARLPYLEQVIKETLRIFSITPGTFRSLDSDLKLPSCGLVVPAGSSVIMFHFLTHRDPRLYPQPMTFDPDRWLPERCAQRHPYAFVPFVAGPRSCIGRRYAMLEMKAVLAQTLWYFRVLPQPGFEPVLTLGITVQPLTGLPMRVEARRALPSP